VPPVEVASHQGSSAHKKRKRQGTNLSASASASKDKQNKTVQGFTWTYCAAKAITSGPQDTDITDAFGKDYEAYLEDEANRVADLGVWTAPCPCKP
jgi:hypothetical protein